MSKQNYTYDDLVKYSDTAIYSSLGNPIDSKKVQSPKYSFGTSTRDAYLKRFGNKYQPIDESLGRINNHPERAQKLVRRNSPSYKIGTSLKNSLDTIKQYDHYRRKDISDINQADSNRRKNHGNIRFSSNSRFSPDKSHLTPGPQDYNTLPNPESSASPKYTMNPKRNRKEEDILINLSATSEILGPGAYLPQESASLTQGSMSPAYSIPKSIRKSFTDKYTIDTNQSYDMTESLGEQLLSKRRTSAKYKIGKQKIDGKRSSIFAAHMEYKPASVRISLPKI